MIVLLAGSSGLALSAMKRLEATRRHTAETVFVCLPLSTSCRDTPVELPSLALEQRPWNARRSI